ncbi:M20 metallopeptidase family protein [Clostridium amazonitimonense]|uniref:M20 metallopeptidase family protein n=1 Tax=Clostridium amazonitimonense TaxID=1499689 RepID=UPI0005094BB8|nr:amidohydrolase [Clostridium amazonitimonense]
MLQELILKKAEDIKEELIHIRRDIHAHPEFALEEIRTSEVIAEKLEAMGLEVQREIGVTGVIGTLRGTSPGKTILLRADMDCLKIEEETGLEFKSLNKGYMHACGHDAHMTWLLGAAMILSDLKEHIKGNVKFLFQPAEEVVGGAERMIKAGALENPKVDAAIGAHVWPSISSGKIGIRYGEMMAAPDVFTIKIIGRGGHGAAPHTCVDPISIACQVYMALQTIVSRRVDAVDPVILTVGRFEAGNAFNIIPNEVIMEGTTRTLNKDLREALPGMMESIIKGITESQGGNYDFEYRFCYPPVINDNSMADLVKEAGGLILGEENIEIMKKPEMIGEDFSYFQNEVPGVFIAIGTLNEEKGINKPLHNACFTIDEDILHKASAVFAMSAIKFLNE